MKRYVLVISIFLVGLMVNIAIFHKAEARHIEITGTELNTLINGVNTLYSGSNPVSATYPGVGQNIQYTQRISIQYKGVPISGAGYSLTIFVSLDGSNYVIPETGGTINTDVTDVNWHVAKIEVPVCNFIRPTFTDVSTATTGQTITAKLLTQ